MRTSLKPILALLLITPFLTELLSNNMPPQAFFNPVAFLFLATAAYGFPVLLLREIACHNRMGISGLLCLGLVYGIINEGIIAKTFFLAEGVPVRMFDNYGYVAGITVPWAITITVWHSIHALLCPMLVTYYLFPAQRNQRWLTRSGTWWIAVPTIALNIFIFFNHTKNRAAGQFSHFVLMLVCMGFLIWLAIKSPRSGQLTAGVHFRLKPLAYGAASFLILCLIPILLAKEKVDLWLFYGYFAIVFTLIAGWLAQQPTIPMMTCLLFTVGNNLATLFWAMPKALGRAGILQLVTDALLVAAFALLLARIWKNNRIQHNTCNGR